MQVRLTLVTDIQTPWPAMVFSKLQDALNSRTKAVQEVSIVTSLELWQVKQLEVDQWREKFCSDMRALHGMTIHDVRVEIIPESNEP